MREATSSSPRTAAALSLLLLVAGCRAPYTPPEQPMPANTILLSGMMRDLSAQPGFADAVLREIDKGSSKGPALLTPALAHDLRDAIVGRNWQHLDRFPGWTMREINPAVRVGGHALGGDSTLEGESSVHPGSPVAGAPGAGSPAGGAAESPAAAAKYLDLGSYALDTPEAIDLNQPSTLPGFTTAGSVSTLGDGVTRGDGPNALAPEHAASQRLADVLNRLAANALTGAQPAAAKVGRQIAQTPADLVAAMAGAGFEVTVIDARYFANFGHFHYQAPGQPAAADVMMPFWVNTRLAIPGTGLPLGVGARPLLIPASHAEYEWSFRSAAHPEMDADLAYYFGIDGKSEWRTMDTLDQAWVLKRAAHTYTGGQAREVTRLAALLTVAYLREHAARPRLPFGGYYALGVCQDGVSAIEMKMTGAVTLFPNTVDAALFNDPRDAEVNAMMRAIPKDRDGHPPAPARVFGSLPTLPGADGRFSAVTIPGLADDLTLSYAAWQEGTVHHTHGIGFVAAVAAAMLLCVPLLWLASGRWNGRRKERRRR